MLRGGRAHAETAVPFPKRHEGIIVSMPLSAPYPVQSYAFFMHGDYPPFDFELSSDDDGMDPHTSLRLTCPGHLERWQPLYKWFLAIPHYFVVAGLTIAAALGIIAGFFAVLFTGQYPEGIRDFLVSSLPLRAPGRGLRRFPHRPLSALQPRRLWLAAAASRMSQARPARRGRRTTSPSGIRR